MNDPRLLIKLAILDDVVARLMKFIKYTPPPKTRLKQPTATAIKDQLNEVKRHIGFLSPDEKGVPVEAVQLTNAMQDILDYIKKTQ